MLVWRFMVLFWMRGLWAAVIQGARLWLKQTNKQKTDNQIKSCRLSLNILRTRCKKLHFVLKNIWQLTQVNRCHSTFQGCRPQVQLFKMCKRKLFKCRNGLGLCIFAWIIPTLFVYSVLVLVQEKTWTLDLNIKLVTCSIYYKIHSSSRCTTITQNVEKRCCIYLNPCLCFLDMPPLFLTTMWTENFDCNSTPGLETTMTV